MADEQIYFDIKLKTPTSVEAMLPRNSVGTALSILIQEGLSAGCRIRSDVADTLMSIVDFHADRDKGVTVKKLEAFIMQDARFRTE